MMHPSVAILLSVTLFTASQGERRQTVDGRRISHDNGWPYSRSLPLSANNARYNERQHKRGPLVPEDSWIPIHNHQVNHGESSNYEANNDQGRHYTPSRRNGNSINMEWQELKNEIYRTHNSDNEQTGTTNYSFSKASNESNKDIGKNNEKTHGHNSHKNILTEYLPQSYSTSSTKRKDSSIRRSNDQNFRNDEINNIKSIKVSSNELETLKNTHLKKIKTAENEISQEGEQPVKSVPNLRDESISNVISILKESEHPQIKPDHVSKLQNNVVAALFNTSRFNEVSQSTIPPGITKPEQNVMNVDDHEVEIFNKKLEELQREEALRRERERLKLQEYMKYFRETYNQKLTQRPQGTNFQAHHNSMITDLRDDNIPFRDPGSLPIRKPQYDKECLNITMSFGCGSCSTAVVCLGNEAYEEACDFPQEVCHKDPSFRGGVCKRDPLPECSCLEGDSHKPDPYDPGSYLSCTGDSITQNTCGPNREYVESNNTCRNIAESPICEHLGTFNNTNDCRWFYSCLYPRGPSPNYHQVFQRCPNPNQVFMNARQECMDAEEVPSTDVCAVRSLVLPNFVAPIIPAPIITAPIIPAPIIPAPIIPAPVIPAPVVPAPAPPAPSTTVAAPQHYTCPIFVLLIIFWWPGVVNYLCWVF